MRPRVAAEVRISSLPSVNIGSRAAPGGSQLEQNRDPMLPKHNNSAPHMFRRIVPRKQGSCREIARTFVREENGQILPLLVVMMILLIGAGMLVLWLGVSTVITSQAQTAADAAALAGEQELVNELQQVHYGPDGQVLPPSYSPTQVCNAAQQYAIKNHSSMSCPSDIQFIPSSTGLFGTDVEVTVHSDEALPSGAPGGANGATASARASTDPFSQASPSVATTTTSCDASVVAGSPFNPPTTGTGPGFFAQKNTDYTQGCEPKLAGKLRALAIAKGLHLVGVDGYDNSSPATGTGGGAGGD
jgi:type II secretory pathway pseudopilin PulG